MEWNEVTATEYCNKIADGTHDSPKRQSFGKYLITSKHIKGHSIDFDKAYFISEDDYQKIIKRSKVDKWDVIISMIGEYCGFCYVEDSDFTDYAVKNVGIFKVGERIKSLWLYYYLTSPDGKAQLKSIRAGSSQPYISLGALRDLIIPVPSIEKMKEIVTILSSLDRKIELNNKINADLEEMAQAIFKNWFVDFEPFKDGKFVDSELGMIPEGWKVGSPYEYVKVVYGAPYKSAKFNDNGEGLPLIRIRDLKDCNPQFYTPEILPQTEYVNKGDIVAGMDAEFVPHIWKGNTGLLNQRVCKLMPQRTSISNLFVLHLMKPELEFVQSYKTGTTVSHLGKADIDKFVVVLPPLEVVEDCSKILDSILQRIKNISAQSRTLFLLRDTLLPRLMSGEIEVPE